MKTFAVLALSALAVVSAQTIPACDVTKLTPVAVTGANAQACQSKTTYSAATATIPTGELLKTVCSTKECNALLEEMKAAVPTPCTFLGKDIKTDVIDKFPAACAAALGGAAANGTAASNSTTAAPNATTAAPTTTTTTPVTTTPVTTTPSATMTNSSTPAPTSRVPSPTPKSSAAVLTVATGAVATTVLAALL